jgi:hypothetical protein
MLIVDLLGSAAVVASWRDSNGDVHEGQYPNQCVQACASNPADLKALEGRRARVQGSGVSHLAC